MSGNKTSKSVKVSADDEYEIEKIIQKRVQNGKVEYFLKWKGYESSENSWVAIDALNCPLLIAEYESGLKKKIRPRKRRNAIDDRARTPSPSEPLQEPRVEKVMGATREQGKLHFLIKWENSLDCKLVPSEEARVLCPLLVIDFYEERLFWTSPPADPQQKESEQLVLYCVN